MTERVRAVLADGTQIAVRHRIEQGSWYADGWITPSLKISFSGLSGLRSLVLPVFCQDTSMRLHNNVMKLQLGPRQLTRALKWGGLTAIELPLGELPKGEAGLILQTSGYLVPDELDSREKAVVIKEMIFKP